MFICIFPISFSTLSLHVKCLYFTLTLVQKNCISIYILTVGKELHWCEYYMRKIFCIDLCNWENCFFASTRTYVFKWGWEVQAFLFGFLIKSLMMALGTVLDILTFLFLFLHYFGFFTIFGGKMINENVWREIVILYELLALQLHSSVLSNHWSLTVLYN